MTSHSSHGVTAVTEIRLHGLPEHCETVAERISRVLDIVRASRPYTDRAPSLLVRVYLTVNAPVGKEQ